MSTASPSTASTSKPGERYERSIQVTSAFFAAFIGFGLKNLLDEAKKASSPAEAADWWALLILAVLLFLRFLLGSANHLSVEYVLGEPTPQRRRYLVFDLAVLVLLGLLAARICFATNVKDFFWWNLWFLAPAFLWGFFAAERRTKTWSESGMWLAINALQAGCVIILLCTSVAARVPYLECQWTLVVLTILYALALLVDFGAQLDALDEAITKQLRKNGEKGAADAANDVPSP
jgi:hypothetical protein